MVDRRRGDRPPGIFGFRSIRCDRGGRMSSSTRQRQRHTHQLQRRRASRSSTPSRKATKTIGAGILLAWALCLRPHTGFDAQTDVNGGPPLAQAFSNGLSPIRRHHPAHIRRAAYLSTQSRFLTIHTPCTFSLAPGHPCRNAFRGGTASDTRKSLFICQSTIRAETEVVDATGPKASVEINVVNGVKGSTFNGLNGAANGVNGSVNGVNGSSNVNGYSSDSINGGKINGHVLRTDDSASLHSPNNCSADVPIPTANGGFTHTASSKAKISAANKGRTPWNKGKSRSDETRARIAEGVRRRNRERFLAKLAEEGITEEEYNERKKAERRKKDAERRARRTAKGGYTPTEETKQKISKILKEKYASGEVKRTPRDPSKVRRGFKHTEETKQKIRESLRRKWAEDVEYRELMTNKTVASGNVGSSVRKRISESLKKKWEDPEFRAIMMEKFANRKANPGKRDESHRKKISAAMKRKWMDEEYRRRATEGMNKGREIAARTIKMAKPVQPKMPRNHLQGGNSMQSLKSLSPLKAKKKRASPAPKTKRKKSTAKRTKRKGPGSGRSSGSKSNIEAVEPMKSSPVANASEVKPKQEKAEKRGDGSISRLREERRDLYDLLYGDDDDDNSARKGESSAKGRADEDSDSALPSGMIAGMPSATMSALFGDDDDLDDFDPYNLEQ
ncbi:hypothetical protein ACHAWF_012221 [Thalassiosira exigua]